VRELTPATLFRIGGVSLLLGGLVGPIGHLVLHPPSHALVYQGGPQWVVAHAVMTFADILILFGMFAFYARFHRRLGLLSLAGFPLLCGLLLYMIFTFGYEATTMPLIKSVFPGEVATGPNGDLSGPFYHGLFPVPLLCAAGVVLFGAALFRSGGRLRWAGAALAASVFVEFAAIIVVHQFPAWEYLLPVADSINLLVFAWLGYATLTASEQMPAAPSRLQPSLV
jgi:hypothetical protein